MREQMPGAKLEIRVQEHRVCGIESLKPPSSDVSLRLRAADGSNVGYDCDGPCVLRVIPFVVAVACVALASPASAAPATPVKDPTGLCFAPADWIGKYPSTKDRHQHTFMQLSCVGAKLKALMPSHDFKRFVVVQAVESPIEQVGKYLVFTRCKPHDCPDDHGMMIVDTESGALFVGLHTRRSSSSVTQWYASDDGEPSWLPAELLARFSRQHEPSP